MKTPRVTVRRVGDSGRRLAKESLFFKWNNGWPLCKKEQHQRSRWRPIHEPSDQKGHLHRHLLWNQSVQSNCHGLKLHEGLPAGRWLSLHRCEGSTGPSCDERWTPCELARSNRRMVVKAKGARRRLERSCKFDAVCEFRGQDGEAKQSGHKERGLGLCGEQRCKSRGRVTCFIWPVILEQSERRSVLEMRQTGVPRGMRPLHPSMAPELLWCEEERKFAQRQVVLSELRKEVNFVSALINPPCRTLGSTCASASS